MAEPLLLGLSFASGSVLFLFSILYGWIIINYFQSSATWPIWVLMLSISYVMAFGWNSIAQKVSCNTIQPGHIAKASVPTLLAMTGALLLSTFLSSPVTKSLPLDMQFGPMSKYIAIGFYAFWAGMFGGVIGAGLSQSCPGK